MRIFVVITAILVFLIGWAKPVNFGMAARAMTETVSSGGTALMAQGFEMACETSACASAAEAQKNTDDCVRHCVKNALPAVEEVAAILFAPFSHFSLLIFIALVSVLALAFYRRKLVRYLLFVYTLFHLRFVTSVVLRN